MHWNFELMKENPRRWCVVWLAFFSLSILHWCLQKIKSFIHDAHLKFVFFCRCCQYPSRTELFVFVLIQLKIKIITQLELECSVYIQLTWWRHKLHLLMFINWIGVWVDLIQESEHLGLIINKIKYHNHIKNFFYARITPTTQILAISGIFF